MQINDAIFDGLIRTGAFQEWNEAAIEWARRNRQYHKADLWRHQWGQLADIFALAGK